ncbi:MAG: hypothetical protein QXF01_02570 [Candidatus Micrarchaeaceae archaeon]
MIKPAYLVAGIIVIIALIFVAMTLNNSGKPVSATQNVQNQTASSTSGQVSRNVTVPIQLTDPPVVPAGTQSLIVAYSNEQVHLSNAGNQSGWVNASGKGEINLMSTVNLSQTIGSVSLPAGAEIDMARFNITYATISINGTAYNVTVPSGKVTAHIEGSTSVTGSNSILLDLSPTVVTIVTNSSVVYVLVPSVKAVIVPSNQTAVTIGSKASLNSTVHEKLESAAPNISITGADVAVNGNNTQIQITVKDNSNQSITLFHAVVFGNETLNFNNTRIQERINQIINSTNELIQSQCKDTVNASANESSDASSTTNNTSSNSTSVNTKDSPGYADRGDRGDYGGYLGGVIRAGAGSYGNAGFGLNTSAGFNVSKFEDHFYANGSIPLGGFDGAGDIKITSDACSSSWFSNFTSQEREAEQQASSRIQAQLELSSHRTGIPLSINSTGSMQALQSEAEFGPQNRGAVVAPGQSITLSFNGTLMPREHESFVSASLVSGSPYKIVVIGTDGAMATANVTAT